MVRKNARRKPVGDGRKGGGGGRDGGSSGAKPGASRSGALKPAGAGTAKASAPAPKGVKLAAKPTAAVPVPKVKFRGKMLENEPLARYTTYRLVRPARYFLAAAAPRARAQALLRARPPAL